MARIIDRNLEPQSTGSGIINSCGFCSFVFLIILIFGGILGYFQVQNYFTFASTTTRNEQTIEFEVKEGETAKNIVGRMIVAGIIEDKQVFFIPASELFFQINSINATQIQVGNHQIPPKTPILEVYNYFRLKECEQVRVTFKEGLRIEEFAETMDKVLVGKPDIKFNAAEFINIARNYKNTSNIKLSFESPTNLEGYLFPDTYNFCTTVTSQQVVDRLLKTFDDKVIPEIGSDLYTKELDLQTIIKKASLVEREAFNNEERKVIAGIIDNRLNIGEVLGIDASSQYSLGYVQSQNTWWAKDYALVQQLQKDEPYNTRKRAGLPPTPIASPSLNSIKSVLNPTKSNYLFYLHNDCGGIHYGRNLSEHNSNVANYIGTGRCN